MVKPSDSNPDHRLNLGHTGTDASVITAQQVLQQGVSALKAKQYDRALALFEQLERTAPPFRTKAQMGKAQVFQQQGKIVLAQQQCQGLLTHSSPKVQQWAQRMLDQLPAPQPGSTLDSPAPAPMASPSSPPTEDKSGFIPLESVDSPAPAPSTPARPPAPDQPADADTGFLPLDSAQAGNDATSNAAARGDVAVSDSGAHGSLFHYQQLNQQLGQSSDGTNSSESTAATAPPESPAPPRGRHKSAPPPTLGQLKRGKPYRLWAVQGLTAIAILWLMHWGLHQSFQAINDGIRFIFRWPVRLYGFDFLDRPHLRLVMLSGIATILASPWLLDWALKLGYQQTPLSSRRLQQQHPQALRLLRRVCRQRGWQLPELRLIPRGGTLCFSYGWSPRTARIALSQDLLDSLNDEELSALYAYELAHIANRDLPVMSGLGLLLLLLYGGYWRLTQWGSRQSQPWRRWATNTVGNLLYGLYWLFRKLGLWLSRLRIEYGDPSVLILHPEAGQYQHLLLTLTRQINQDLQQRGHLHPLLASLDLLMPLSLSQAISPGSYADRVGVAQLVAEDCLNPYRYWLVANNSHPMIGDRLLFLQQWASYWQQNSLGLTLDQLTAAQPGAKVSSRGLSAGGTATRSRISLSDLLIQNSPLIGLLTGVTIAMVLWFSGGVVNRFNWQQISWLYQDDSVLQGGVLIGLGMGLLIRVNRLFPERRSLQVTPDNASEILFRRAPTLPVDGQPISLDGTLMGGGDLTNSLCQTLFLQDGAGIVRLKCTSPLHWWRGLALRRSHPSRWMGRQATVLGWLRRAGGRLWIDVNSIQVAGQPAYQIYSPQWTTGIGVVLGLWGVWKIFAGG